MTAQQSLYHVLRFQRYKNIAFITAAIYTQLGAAAPCAVQLRIEKEGRGIFYCVPQGASGSVHEIA